MALNKLKFNSINVTPAASEAIRFNSSANGLETASAGGSLVKIASTTASSSASVSFTSGITSTYKEYIFFFNNIHPQTDDVGFMFNLSIDSGSNYNVTKTTTYFNAFHNEGGNTTSLQYSDSYDLAQSTGNQYLANDSVGDDSDQCASGFLHLFNPSSTTFVKHFIARVNHTHEAQFTVDQYIAGYGNTTSAIDAVRFSMESGNIDSGTITMYGVL
jgi:hypothetical protein|tara:strand:+ start:1227 stop:1874 length:648 start_codon:yes stop_codon:yes gene_type:complete